MKNSDQKKSEAIIEKKIYVMPYVLSNDPYDDEDWYLSGVLISDNQKSLEECGKKQKLTKGGCCLKQNDLIEMGEYEARERYGDDLISTILRKDGYVEELEDDCIYDETYMSIEKLEAFRNFKNAVILALRKRS